VGASAINNNNNRGTNLASKFEVRPFVGVSAEINLSMRIGNKKKK
jgi:hypothetical protein